MNAKSRLKPQFRLAPLFVVLVVVLATFPMGATTAASPAQVGQGQPEPPGQYLPSEISSGEGPQGRCVPYKIIQQFVNEHQIRSKGFFIDLFGSGSLSFARQGHYKYASFHVASNPSAQLSASRMTEADTSLPPEQRIKCWQPTARRDVVVEFVARFKQATTPPELTETLLLWNSPIGSGGHALPTTGFGVTRNQAFPGYVAIAAQDLVLEPFSGFVEIAPVPTWLDPTDWHQVRIQVSQQKALIEVAQGRHGYTTVLKVALPQPLDEPLAFEFSLDNEVMPGVVIPVTVPDTLDVAFLSMYYKPIKH
jgi:hypothetical protein